MKISVAMAFNEFTTPELIKAAVQMAEAKGVHGIWVPEHVLFFPNTRRPILIQRTAACPETRKVCWIPSVL